MKTTIGTIEPKKNQSTTKVCGNDDKSEEVTTTNAQSEKSKTLFHFDSTSVPKTPKPNPPGRVLSPVISSSLPIFSLSTKRFEYLEVGSARFGIFLELLLPAKSRQYFSSQWRACRYCEEKSEIAEMVYEQAITCYLEEALNDAIDFEYPFSKLPRREVRSVLPTAIGMNNVHCYSSSSNPFGCMFLLDVVVNRRTKNKSSFQQTWKNDKTIVLPTITNKRLVSNDFNDQFRAWILFAPLMDQFYCTMSNKCIFVPFPAGYLRLNGDGRIRSGSFIREIKQCFLISAVDEKRTPEQLPHSIMDVYQMPDEVDPPLPSNTDGSFRMKLHKSKSNRSGGRCFVRGAHHEDLSSSLCWDPVKNGTLDIVVRSPHPFRKSSFHYSIVSVRYLGQNNKTIQHIVDVGSAMDDFGERNARNKSGDHGKMNLVGFNLNPGRPHLGSVTKVTSQLPDFQKMVASVSLSLEKCLPMVLEPMRAIERSVNVYPPKTMGYTDGITATCDFSVNLGNASHYDPGDVGPGVSIWAEKIDGRSSNWYFVMPNFLPSKVRGATSSLKVRNQSGVSIKLSNGVCILWNGRVIRHCTSITNVGDKNATFGVFFAPKEKIIKKGSDFQEVE